MLQADALQMLACYAGNALRKQFRPNESIYLRFPLTGVQSLPVDVFSWSHHMANMKVKAFFLF